MATGADSPTATTTESDSSDQESDSRSSGALAKNQNTKKNGSVGVTSKRKVSKNDASTSDGLPDCMKKRSYACPPCNLMTHNPRTYLYHLRDTHNEIFKIHECKLCIYASKGAQNLGRHIQMCHGPGKKDTGSGSKQPEGGKTKKIKTKHQVMEEDPASVDATEFLQTELSMEEEEDDSPPDLQPYYQPEVSLGELQAQLMGNGIKSNGVKRKREYNITGESFSCPICNYVTNIKSRFTKHVRYHSMPVTKCEHCDFKSPYKWNLDRHALSHSRGGEKVCPLCSFSTDIKQSLTFHLHTHHSSIAPEEIEAIILKLNSESLGLDLETEPIPQPSAQKEVLKSRQSLPTMEPNNTKRSKLFNAGKPVPNLIPISPEDGTGDKSDFLQTLALNPVRKQANLQQQRKLQGVGLSTTLRQKQRKLVFQKQRIADMSVLKKKVNASILRQKLVYRPTTNINPKFSILKKTLVGKSVNDKAFTMSRPQLPPPPTQTRKPVPIQPKPSTDDEGLWLPCTAENCPARFRTSVQLKTHKAFHVRRSAFKCKFCTYSVDSPEVIALHMRSHGAGSVPSSPRGPKPESRASASPPMAESEDTEEVDETWLVGNPGFNYTTYFKNGREKLKRYKCQMCPFSTEKRDQYRVHIRLHGSNQTYTCDICQYSVLHYANFKQHKKLHENQQDPSVAQDESSQEPSYSSPTLTSNEFIGMIFRCNMCPFATTTKKELRSHMYQHLSMNANAPVKKLQICSICHFGTRDKAAYLEHQKLHFNLHNKLEKPESYISIRGVEVFAKNEDEDVDGMGEKIFSQNEECETEDYSDDGQVSYFVDFNTGITYTNDSS